MTNNLEIYRTCPHVVILGAGASVAAIPNGDKFGRKISVMDGFIDNLGMRDLLKGIKFKSENLEDIYSELSAHQEYDVIREKLEESIRDYFSQYYLPEDPTIYDLLLLSLKEKDIVATFNWDPLLVLAYLRCREITIKLPQVLFLHGNVAVQLCLEDKKSFLQLYQGYCGRCKKQLSPCRLLYPVQQKNYNADPYIKNQWDRLKYYLSCAYIVTIFGYSAPTTDVEAVNLLLEAWGGGEKRKWEEIEIIDIDEEEKLEKKWKRFIYSHHYQIHKNFYDSLIAESPRRSTEDLYARLVEAQWIDTPNKLSPGMTWDDVKKHFAPILAEEEKEVQNDK